MTKPKFSEPTRERVIALAKSRMRPPEIAAVTGLKPSQVHAILKHVPDLPHVPRYAQHSPTELDLDDRQRSFESLVEDLGWRKARDVWEGHIPAGRYTLGKRP